MRLFHENLRNLLLRRGYRVDCVRSIPCQLLDPCQVIRLEFEDAVCRRMVEVARPLKFVQIGAFDGTTHDPLYPFIVKHGWAGVLVEPQRIACKLLLRLSLSWAGFEDICREGLGVSRHSLLRGMECVERYPEGLLAHENIGLEGTKKPIE